jgi:hypothetical protein
MGERAGIELEEGVKKEIPVVTMIEEWEWSEVGREGSSIQQIDHIPALRHRTTTISAFNPEGGEFQSSLKNSQPVYTFRLKGIVDVDGFDWRGSAWDHIGEWDIREVKGV